MPVISSKVRHVALIIPQGYKTDLSSLHAFRYLDAIDTY